MVSEISGLVFIASFPQRSSSFAFFFVFVFVFGWKYGHLETGINFRVDSHSFSKIL